MSDRNPRSLWDELLRALRGSRDQDEDRASVDPNLLFHLLVTVPMIIGLLAMARRP